MANIFTSDKIKGKRWQVYALVCPTTQEIKYIGVTFGTLQQRFWEHISALKVEYTPKANWIRGLLAKGLKPQIVMLQDGYGSDWSVVERGYIAKYRLVGTLTNKHYQHMDYVER